MDFTKTVDQTVSISQIAKRFNKTRMQSLKLVKPLEVEDFVVQTTMDVSPPKWHLAHVTWFFENFILVPHLKSYKVYDTNYSYLFNSYYVSAGDRWTRAKRGNLTRPTVNDILKFRQYVDDHMNEWFDSISQLTPELTYILEIGIQHEQQHQELMVYDIKSILGENPLFPAYREDLPSFSNQNNQKVEFDWFLAEEGKYSIGFSGKGFCFDNELNNHIVYLQPFALRKQLVTNEEYLEFLEDNGYSRDEFWMMEGKEWVDQNEIKSPKYWHKIDDEWFIYQLSGLEKLDPHQPVSHVSFYEADAFAKWKGLRLPTEQEWEVVSGFEDNSNTLSGNFVEEEFFKPISTKQNMLGNLWEWTESAYRPYPGYKAPTGALGEYNGKFMINQMVLRGGSYATPRDHIRKTYRNFFHPHLQWHCNGIRLAKDLI